MNDSKRRPPRVANDAPSGTKQALWRWAEDQDQLSIGPKAFLCHLTDHADDHGRVYVVSRHFQRLMSASARSITNYLRKLEAYDLIAETGDYIIFPGVRLPIYRLAPNDPWISALIDGSEDPADPKASSEGSKFGKTDTRVSKLDTKLGKTQRAYIENSTYSNLKTPTDASLPGLESAGASVRELPCDPSSLEPAVEFYPHEFMKDFEEIFGSHLFEHFLGAAKACPKTETLHPDTPNAYGWYKARAMHFLKHRNVGLGKPWKVLARG